MAALNDLSILACIINNAYLTTTCCKNVWMVAGPKFRSDYGENMLLVRALYLLNTSGEEFISLMVEMFMEKFTCYQ